MPQCADTMTFHRTHAKRMDGIHQHLVVHSWKNSQLDLFQLRAASGQVPYFCARKNPKKCCLLRATWTNLLQNPDDNDFKNPEGHAD